MKLLKDLKEGSKERHESPFAVDRNFSEDAAVVDNFLRQQASVGSSKAGARISDIAGMSYPGKYIIVNVFARVGPNDQNQ